MTQRVSLPTESEVRHTLTQMRQADDSKPITARDLARQLGLANSTFWRHFPLIAQEVADERRSTRRLAPTMIAADQPHTESDAAIRAENARLREQIELAVAHIQRITLENHALRARLESQAGLALFPRRP